MAQFRAGIQGSRGAVTRLGGAASGITAFVHGWDIGVDVAASHDAAGDCINVYVTGGSHARMQRRLLVTIRDGHVTVHTR